LIIKIRILLQSNGNDWVQVYHPYNIDTSKFLELPGYWNVHDELAEIKFTLEALEYYTGVTKAKVTSLAPLLLLLKQEGQHLQQLWGSKWTKDSKCI
jgi:hypothetical protein